MYQLSMFEKPTESLLANNNHKRNDDNSASFDSVYFRMSITFYVLRFNGTSKVLSLSC